MKKTPFVFDLVQDFLAFVLLTAAGGSALFATRELALRTGASDTPWLWPALFLVFLSFWCAANGAIFWSCLAWNLREGTFPLGGNRATVTWYLEFALRRFISYDPFGRFIHAFKWLRTLRYWSFGAHIPYSVNFSADIEIQSPKFVTIGPRSMIGSHSILSARMLDGGNLIYRAIEIGEEVQIALQATIGPGVRIGDRTKVGAQFNAYPLCRIGRDCVIEEGVRVELGARIGDGARIGRHAVITERSKVEAGAVIPPFGRV